VFPCARRIAWPALLAVAALAITLCLAAPPRAGAVIDESAVVDGPSADIVGLDGVAMAGDGTGGVVYRKRVGGKVHIFAAQFVGGTWKAPQQVDVGQKYSSSWPAIGAAPGGRLVVVWVQQYGGGTQDRMFSASLGVRATSFQAPIPFDLNVGDGSDIAPSLAMNVSGQALLTYRVITSRDLTASGVPPGYVREEIRLARYDGGWWTPAGVLMNRNPSQPMPGPTPDNGPKVAMDDSGGGLLAWQEPDDGFVPRVYARRVFSGSTTVPLIVSPQSWPWGDDDKGLPLGKPLNGSADAIAVSLRGLSEGAVAYRQQPSPGSVLTGTRALVSPIPSATSEQAAAFLDPQLGDGGTDAKAPTGNVGAPAVATSSAGAYDALLSVGTQVIDASGDEGGALDPVRLDDRSSSIAPEPVVARADDGALAAAWKVRVGDTQGIEILERRADGTPGRRLVGSPLGGALGPLDLAGSGLGDAAIAFQQGAGKTTEIMGTAIDAPPSAFTVVTPIGWTHAKRIPISWEAAPSAIGKVTYTLVVDDQEVQDGLTKLRYTLTSKDLTAGRHTVSVIAFDGQGQPTTGTSSDVLVDRTAPTAKLHVRGRTLRVTVSDGRKRSGVQSAALTVKHGRTVTGRASLRYRFTRAGTYAVSIRTTDKAGNHRTVRKRVRIR
jgi:hypothetical protein